MTMYRVDLQIDLPATYYTEADSAAEAVEYAIEVGPSLVEHHFDIAEMTVTAVGADTDD